MNGLGQYVRAVTNSGKEMFNFFLFYRANIHRFDDNGLNSAWEMIGGWAALHCLGELAGNSRSVRHVDSWHQLASGVSTSQHSVKVWQDWLSSGWKVDNCNDVHSVRKHVSTVWNPYRKGTSIKLRRYRGVLQDSWSMTMTVLLSVSKMLNKLAGWNSQTDGVTFE